MEERIAQLKTAAELIRTERRRWNNRLNALVAGKIKEYNGEDLMRLVGTLEAAYNHCLASIAGDGDIYCLLKHISYAIILAGELDEPDVESLYEIITIISNGAIEPCAACKSDAQSENVQGTGNE